MYTNSYKYIKWKVPEDGTAVDFAEGKDVGTKTVTAENEKK
jgi:hypothetical protein